MDGMEKKWCHSCQVFRQKDGFKLVKTGNRNKPVMRWKCEFCLKRESERKYGK
jgi:hypothetical protein